MGKALIALCMLAFTYAGGARPAFAANFSVQSVKICQGYSSPDHQRVGEVDAASVSTERWPNARIFVAVTIAGGSDAVAFLRENDHLPVIVKLWKNGVRQNDIDIGIDFGKWNAEGNLYLQTFEQDGLFYWRTMFNARVRDLRRFYFTLDDFDSKTARFLASDRKVEYEYRLRGG